MRTLIRLGWSQLAIVVGGLGTVLLVVWIAFMPEVEDFYTRKFLLPQIADRYGFQFGIVPVSRDRRSEMLPGIVSVTPGGVFARIGVRSGDMPFAVHGNGALSMYAALMVAERGQIAEFDVINADDWSGARERQAIRTIRLHPDVRSR